MITKRARAIPELGPGAMSILAPVAAPAVAGNGHLNIVCGTCGTLLFDHVQPYISIRNLVVRCPNCKQCNDIG